MTKREGAIIGAYTGILVGAFSDLHGYVEEILGRPIFTHEFAFNEINDEIKQKSKSDFMELAKSIGATTE